MISRRWVLALLAVSFLAACSEDDDVLPPLPRATLSGRVTDAGGSPVAGAFINFEYTVLFNGDVILEPAATGTPSGDIGPGGPFTLEIFDHNGRFIRRIEGDGGGIIQWNGRDEAGNLVPEGPYRYVLTVEGQDPAVRWIIVTTPPEERKETRVVTTGGDGRYSLPLGELPVWMTIPGGIDGVSGEFTFGSRLAVYAFRGDGTSDHDRKIVEIATPNVPVVVDLSIP